MRLKESSAHEESETNTPRISGAQYSPSSPSVFREFRIFSIVLYPLFELLEVECYPNVQ